ncbi:MAG: chemotaxis protein CheY-P-specific phosphatase CheC [Alteromonadaceae bacterium]
MRKSKTINTEDVLITLCESVSQVLTKASGNRITYSGMVQKISRTCLRPDIGCFVLFDGGFNGIVVTNFTATAALEVYQDYMTNMGMPDSEISKSHLADDVANVLGELMNQIVGGFTYKVREQLQTTITQSQPKMLVINKLVHISVDTVMDRPQARRVTFTTTNNNIFYLELAMDKTEFIKLHDFEIAEEIDPDDILEATAAQAKNSEVEITPEDDSDVDDSDVDDDDFMASLGL